MSSKIFNNSNGHLKTDKLLRLSEAEKTLRAVLNSAPSRPTLIGYIESGRLRGVRHPFNKYYYVFRSSLDEFIEEMIENTA